MTNKDLIAKLNNLKNLTPDDSWLKNNRELFLTQISNSGANKLSAWEVIYINFKSFLKASSQPVFALGVFMIVLVASSIFSHKLFSQAKPNDSLYIARIISEKAKLNTVLNPVEKNKLAVRFSTDHAKDISTVLADPNFNNEENKDQVAKLSDSFNKEIDNVRTLVNVANSKPVNQEEPAKSESIEMSDEAISIASEYKVEQGIQIKEAEGNIEPVLKTSASLKTATKTPEKVEKVATSTSPEKTSTSSEIKLEVETEVKIETKIEEADKMIDSAKESFNNKDYNSVIEKLNEVKEIIK